MDALDDVLPASATLGVELPEATLRALTTTGVPRELRLPEWPGPTLFTSELGGGRLVSTADPAAIVARTGAETGYLLGSVRDTTGDVGHVHAAFALRRGTGEVFLLEVLDPSIDRFVASDLAVFLTALDAFHTAWPLMVSGPTREAVVASFRALLTKLDARALEDPESYWPGWLEELE